jgi:hypothetical protein
MLDTPSFSSRILVLARRITYKMQYKGFELRITEDVDSDVVKMDYVIVDLATSVEYKFYHSPYRVPTREEFEDAVRMILHTIVQ